MTTHLSIAVESLDGAAAYKIISGIVVPRPIAWVASLNPDGGINLAPFSSFIFLTYDPPKIGISIGPATAWRKDTLSNIERTGHFTTNSVSVDQLQPMANTSRLYPAGESEAHHLGIALAPSDHIVTPRIADSEASMECVVDKILSLEDRDAHHLVIGRVVGFQIATHVFKHDRLDPALYRPVGRIGGPHYFIPGEVRGVQPVPDPRLSKKS
jgi:flavin reductase (DIM6/NTAB) family NADH-FMN oxidoreductase RutF